MKLECTQENFNRGLLAVGRMVGTRTTLPVLANIKLETKNGRLELQATDLEVGIIAQIGAKIEATGKLTLPARLLSEFVSTNQDKTIKIEASNSEAVLKSEHYSATIRGIAADEFPAIPTIKRAPLVKLPSQEFKRALQVTSFGAAIDETRPILAGVLLRFTDSTLKLVATDSYRLAEKTLHLKAKIASQSDVVIPTRTANELIRLLEDDAGEVSILVGDNQAEFIFGNLQLVSRVIEGSFPDYEQIMPKEFVTSAEVPRIEFNTALKMASFFARESANNIKLKITKDNIEVIASSPQLGNNNSQVPAAATGEDLEAAFNARFILDVLGVIAEPAIKLEFAGRLKPALISPLKNHDFRYVIMPLRTEE